MSGKKSKLLLIKEETILCFSEGLSLKKFEAKIFLNRNKLSKYRNIRFKIEITDDSIDSFQFLIVGDRVETEEETLKRAKRDAKIVKNANSHMEEYVLYLRLKEKFEP